MFQLLVQLVDLFFSPFALDQLNLQLFVGVGEFGGALGYSYLQRLFRLLQFSSFRLKLGVNLHRTFVGRDEQIQNLLLFGGDKVRLATKVKLYPDLQSFRLSQLYVRQDKFDSRNQVFVVVGFPDETIRTAFQPPNNVLRSGKRR
jgi:hypothetical protein